MFFFYIVLTLLFIMYIYVNIYIKITSYKKILNCEPNNLKDYDCMLVLGAGIINNERPTLMLKDRLDKSIELYNKGIIKKIIMSGDHSKVNHDEVGIMKKYAIDRGIKSKDIFMDHAGICTYDSIYRAKEIFGVKKMIIITQKYHLYRALYISNFLGIDAHGIKSDARIYRKMPYHLVRESLARVKNFIKCNLKAKPKYLGDKISLEQSGDVTGGVYFDK